MVAYYNENNPYAAQWLRNLIAAGHIAPGVVDERSIEDVRPADLVGYTQCHFFAGIGVWSHALRRAGWPDDRPVWSGSCPCQPFSTAGKGDGFADERHLWPAWQWLIAECKPAVVFGEQVASKAVEPWVDLVHADLEALGYAFGGVPFPAASVGAPHIRDRLYWVAYAEGSRRARESLRQETGRPTARAASVGQLGGLEHPQQPGLEGQSRHGDYGNESGRQRADTAGSATETGGAGGMADTEHSGYRRPKADEAQQSRDWARDGILDGSGSGLRGPTGRPTDGFWRAADWLLCRDGKWRPVEPGTFPLAHGAAARVGRLHGYGNAINAEAARIFIEAYDPLL